MKCRGLFSGKMRKAISMSLLKILPSMLSVNGYLCLRHTIYALNIWTDRPEQSV